MVKIFSGFIYSRILYLKIYTNLTVVTPIIIDTHQTSYPSGVAWVYSGCVTKDYSCSSIITLA